MKLVEAESWNHQAQSDFSESARPCFLFGKKNEILLIDDANAPPPMPLIPANNTKLLNVTSLFRSRIKMPNMGTIAMNEFIVLCIRVPQIATMNVLTTRRLAPTSPASDASIDVAILYCLSSSLVGFATST